jgi:hypothetical protein
MLGVVLRVGCFGRPHRRAAVALYDITLAARKKCRMYRECYRTATVRETVAFAEFFTGSEGDRARAIFSPASEPERTSCPCMNRVIIRGGIDNVDAL